jgi:hypothetical protein
MGMGWVVGFEPTTAGATVVTLDGSQPVFNNLQLYPLP